MLVTENFLRPRGWDNQNESAPALKSRSSIMEVIRKERGWCGHYICCDKCLFRRNTLLTYRDVKIVVSTVGMMMDIISKEFDTIGMDRYYETMAFFALEDDEYNDIDVNRQVVLRSQWTISEMHADNRANDMHEAAVDEIIYRLEKYGSENMKNFQ